MRNRLCMISLFLIMLAACGGTPELTPGAQPPPTSPPDHPCGDGICQGPENPINCPEDCPPVDGTSPPRPPEHPDAESGEYWITNPSSGVDLYVRLFVPADWDGAGMPTLVLVPGGIGDGSDFTEGRNDAEIIADAGFTVVVFDPDGRGNSGGEEDKNGHIHQDGLAAIIQEIATYPEVDAQQIGLVSFSYGVTMASGALARYPDLPVIFYIDWEGPANREDTTFGCQPGRQGVGSIEFMSDCSDEAFWSEREGQTFIAQVRIPYQRLQSQQDHAQQDHSHAIDMINAAIAGGVPWVRLNDLPPNQTYDESSLPPMLPESLDRDLAPLVAEYATEMLSLR